MDQFTNEGKLQLRISQEKPGLYPLLHQALALLIEILSPHKNQGIISYFNAFIHEMVDEVLSFLFGPTFHNLKIALHRVTFLINFLRVLFQFRHMIRDNGLRNAATRYQQ
jgi:hypothetical protein